MPRVDSLKIKLPYSFKLAFLLSVYSIQNDFEHFVLYILFATTSMACDFMTFFGKYYMFRTTAMLIRKSISGILADWFGASNILVLRICVITQLGIECVMLFLLTDPWTIVIMQLIRGTVNAQSQFSIFKILKMHLQRVFPWDTETQAEVINTLQAWGTGISTFTLMCFLYAGWWTSVCGFTITTVKYLIYGPSLMFTLLTLFLSFQFDREFVDTSGVPSLEQIASGGKDDGVTAQLITRSEGDERVGTDHHLQFRSYHTSFVDTLSTTTDFGRKKSSIQGFGEYVSEGFKVLWTNKVAFNAIVMYLLLWVFEYVVYVSLTLDEANAHPSSHVAPTLDNFCDGKISVLLQQGYMLNIIYSIGSIFYALVIAPFKPKNFFRWGYPILGLTLIGGSLGLLLNISSTTSSLLVSLLGFCAFAYYSYFWNVGLASIPQEFVGFFQSALGLAGALLLYIPSFFTAAGVKLEIVIIFVVAVLTVSIFWSIGTSFAAKEMLREMEELSASAKDQRKGLETFLENESDL
eukprot:TRINITY_DN11092_c0_g1_i1.p1 TRINITY_DN11092_c0_g1~~TRINITY_DN11092_c0_g1_i1.p1  ORF type:complete len:521 (+),score=136.53 TRINITY_DN11092_c0_g1_i1:80-1642(+)